MAEAQAELTDMVDRKGITVVLEALVVVCTDKATHFEEVRNDPEGAEGWRLFAQEIESALLTANA